jgi:hypothetical protein
LTGLGKYILRPHNEKTNKAKMGKSVATIKRVVLYWGMDGKGKCRSAKKISQEEKLDLPSYVTVKDNFDWRKSRNRKTISGRKRGMSKIGCGIITSFDIYQQYNQFYLGFRVRKGIITYHAMYHFHYPL